MADAPANPFGTDPLLSELAYRVRRFGEVIPDLVGRRLALYGAGAIAREVIHQHADKVDIMALVEEHPSRDDVEGIPVLSLEDAVDRGVDTIVIATKSSVELYVARRIGAFCAERGIALLDLYGNDVPELMSHDEALPLDRLLGLVEGYDVLCVDAASLRCNGLEYWVTRQAGIVVPRDEILRLVRHAKECGVTTVTLVEEWGVGSYTSEFLDGFDVVLRTGELGCTKESGVFRVLRSRFPGKRIAHVGSGRDRDALMPRLVGVDGYCLLEGEEVPLEERLVGTTLSRPGNGAERVMLDMLERGPSREGTSPQWSFGYRCLGPLLVGYVSWLANNVHELDGVIFPARDGWLMRRAYEAFVEARSSLSLPPSCYLPISRKAALRAILDEPEFRDMLPSCVSGLTPSEMLRDFVGLSEDRFVVASGHDADDERDRRMATLDNADAIARAAQEARENMLRHLDLLGLGAGKAYAFCDFAALGTCQLLFQQIVPFELHGLYVGLRNPQFRPEGANPRSFLPVRRFGLDTLLLTIEPYLCSADPCLAGFDGEGRPVYARETRDAEDIGAMLLAHEGAMAFVGEFLAEPGSDDGVVGERLVCEVLEHEVDTMPPLGRIDDLTGKPYALGTQAAAERSVRDVLLGLLGAFDRVCSKHGLSYVATHGTLLGAVRDGGFAAGDDDLDVAMPRADYDRLVELAQEGAFAEPYALQTPENDPSCFVGGYARLRDASTTAVVPGDEDRDGNQGMWMDVMPLDDCPVEDAAVERRQRIVRTWQRALYAKTYGFDMRRLWGTDPRKMSGFFLLADLTRRDVLLRRLRRACTACRPTGMLTIFCGNYRNRRNDVRFRAEDVATARRVPFCGTTIPIPANAEDWLDRRYGPSWREVPEELPERSAHDVLLDPNMPYEQYLRSWREGQHD